MSDEDIPSWEETQKRTFTRWCNELLKERNIVIKDLATDLSDGLKLIALYEVLAQKQVKKYNKGPKKLAAKRDNIQIALDCFTKGENVTLVSIRKFCILYIKSRISRMDKYLCRVIGVREKLCVTI